MEPHSPKADAGKPKSYTFSPALTTIPSKPEFFNPIPSRPTSSIFKTA